MNDFILKKLYIEEYKGFKDFEITFEEDVNILVGENGSGKTTLFEIIYNILTFNKSFFENNNFAKIELTVCYNEKNQLICVIKNDEKVEFIFENDEDFANVLKSYQKILYFPADVSFTNFIVNGPAKMDSNDKDEKLDSEKMSKDLKQYLVNSKFLDLNDTSENKQATRIEHLKDIFNNFFDDKEFINIDVTNFEPIFRLKDNNQNITLSELSLGEKQVFYKGCSLVQYTENKRMIVLIDEPETSLHPEWQQKVLDLYKNINENNQYIFATHSPHIVSCCSKDKIKLIEKIGNELKLRENIEETYGANNEELLYDIFNLDSVRNIEIQNDIDRYRDLYYRRKFISNDEFKELEMLKEKLLSIKSLPKDFIPLLELDINTQRLSEI